MASRMPDAHRSVARKMWDLSPACSACHCSNSSCAFPTYPKKGHRWGLERWRTQRTRQNHIWTVTLSDDHASLWMEASEGVKVNMGAYYHTTDIRHCKKLSIIAGISANKSVTRSTTLGLELTHQICQSLAFTGTLRKYIKIHTSTVNQLWI